MVELADRGVCAFWAGVDVDIAAAVAVVDVVLAEARGGVVAEESAAVDARRRRGRRPNP
jgi:hypothetical protein